MPSFILYPPYGLRRVISSLGHRYFLRQATDTHLSTSDHRYKQRYIYQRFDQQSLKRRQHPSLDLVFFPFGSYLSISGFQQGLHDLLRNTSELTTKFTYCTWLRSALSNISLHSRSDFDLSSSSSVCSLDIPSLCFLQTLSRLFFDFEAYQVHSL